MDKKAGKIVRRCVICGGDECKPGEVTRAVHEVSFATIVGDLARCPEIDVKDADAQRPRKDELAVASDGAIGSDAVWALKHPLRDILATARPEEAETDAVQSLVDSHVTSGWRGMAG